MKKAYRLLALVLILFVLSGCGSDGGSQIIGGNNVPTDAPESNANVQYIPEKIKDGDGLPVLKCVCVLDARSIGGQNERKTCREDAINAVNQYLKENSAGFQIQMVMVTGVEHSYGVGIDCFDDSRVREAAADADLLYADFFPERMTEYLEPLTPYVSGENALLSNAVPHDSMWFRTSLEGAIYGLPFHYNSPAATGWIVEPEVMEKCGLTVEDFQREYWQMDEVFARIYEVYGTEFMMVAEDSSSLTRIDGQVCAIPENVLDYFRNNLTFVTSCYGIDTSGERPTIVNILNTDYIKQLQQATQRYTAASYTFPNGKAKTSLVGYAPIYTDGPILRDGKWYIPVGQHWNKFQMYGFMLGVTKSSQRKPEAVSFLQRISEDTQLRNMLCFGQEGINYTLENGIGVPVAENRHDMSFLTPMADFGGFDTWNWPAGLNRFDVEDNEDALEVYRRIMDASKTLCPLDYRYWFDFSGLENEIKAVNETVRLDGASFSKLTPEEYEDWMQKIRDAGGDKIQAELQRQLDEWLAKNPGWE